MEVVQVLVLLLVSLECSECVRCFARFDLTSGEGDEELGEVEEEECCQNTEYSYQTTDGAFQSCGHPVWSPWSSWSQCNILCGHGVRQRNRTCFGIGQSDCNIADDQQVLQVEPCSSTCCDAKGWDLWLPWSPCSITCGEGGVRKRRRVCTTPECLLACTGASEETEKCPPLTCPVHGGWSSWSSWSKCSGSCVDEQHDTSKLRHRSCSNPAPSSDTVPPGNSCPGKDLHVTECSDLPNCPVDGNWGPWSQYGPCSVSCGEGLQLSSRTCNRPAPKYGGRFCDGPATKSNVCQSPCAVDGFWTGWSSWTECSSSCNLPNRAARRSRRRACFNPRPLIRPARQRLPRCCRRDRKLLPAASLPWYMDGGWGSWSPFTPCPVTCGVGLQVSVRKCDSPATNYGGRPCPGEERRTSICTTKVHCPVNGVWSEWSPWSQCESSTHKKNITCVVRGGSQSQERQCLQRAHGGAICEGNKLLNIRVCYDVHNCLIKGSWEGWTRWSFCEPSCGEKSSRSRKRYCKPDYSLYRKTIGLLREVATFSGTPLVKCNPLPDGEEESQINACSNAPPCPPEL